MATKNKKTAKSPDFDFRTIGNIEDACKHQNFDPATIPDLSSLPGDMGKKFRAGILLGIFFMAINNGWKPDYTDSNQAKYFPWPWVSSSGFVFSASRYGCDRSRAGVGSRLCTDSSEKALWALEKCEDLFKEWLL